MTQRLIERRVNEAYANVTPRESSWAKIEALMEEEQPERAAFRWQRPLAAAVVLCALLAGVLVERGRHGQDQQEPGPAASPFDGTWDLTLRRPGMIPETCSGQLRLSRQKKRWQGTLAFARVLFARAHELSDIVVRKKRIEFAIVHDQFELRFSGRLSKDRIEGTCKWKRLGSYPFEAVRAQSVERFEKGLRFRGDFERGEPEKLGIDAAALDRIVKTAQDAKTDALLVAKDGHVLCERYFGGKDTPIHLMSVTKVVSAMAVMLLLEEGRIGELDAPLSTWFKEWGEGRKAKATLRHLLTHTSGIRHGKTAKDLNAAKDRVGYVRALDLDAEPGTRFSYNNEAVALLSGVVKAASGVQTDDYVAKRIFKPLGIKKWAWDRDHAGNTVTYAQLALRARDLARVGRLVANKGRWKGKQVVAEASIQTMGSQGSEQNPSLGLMWWVVREDGEPVAYYHTGWLGQWIVVLPRSNIVGVRLRRAGTPDDPRFEFGGFLNALRNLEPRATPGGQAR